jgi:phage terminase large subunit GpA-like protein
MQADLADSYRNAVQKRTNLEPAEWAKKHVRLFRSTDANTFRPEYTPWWPEPMREIRDNANKVICVTTPVGSGKSTMIEAMVCNILDGDPGPMLITGQTDEDIRDWAETGLWPSLKACEPIQNRLPTARGQWRKMELIIPRSPIHLTGANISGLQSKSERWILGDEAWMWKPGLAGEFLKRLHRRWNGRAVLLGQAGFLQTAEGDEKEREWWWEREVVGDDFSLLHYQGEQREWCFRCPECGEVQPYLLSQLKMPEEGTIAERAQEVVYECKVCHATFSDDVKNRRTLAESARYQKMREAILPGHVSFHLNALALWRSPWSEIALEYLVAEEAQKKGQTLKMQQFTQKQMAEPWDDAVAINRPDLDLFEGSKEDFASGEKIDGEVLRFATIDPGRDHYNLAIRAWRADASSVGLYYSRVSTEEMVKKICIDRGVAPHQTYIDSGYEAGRAYDLCARFGWVAIKGDDAAGYPHRKAGGGTVQRLMSKRKTILAPCGKRVSLIHLAVNPLKDILARLRGGEGAAWQVVPDIGDSWVAQIDSEEREEFEHPKTKQLATRWVKRKRANHAWDCEVYQIGAALIWKVFPD